MRSIKRDLEQQRLALSSAIKALGAARNTDHGREVIKDPYGAASITHDDEINVTVADQRARQLEAVNRALDDIDAGRYEMAWVDAGHNGSAIMFSEGGHAAAGIAVLGSYFATDGSAAWGWRTTIETPADDRLLITAWNVSPDGDEARATEIEYRRRGGSGNGSVG